MLIITATLQFTMNVKENEIEIKEGYDEESNYCESTIKLQKYLKSSVESILKNVPDENFVNAYKICYKEFEKRDDVNRPSLSGSSVEARKYRNQFNTIIMKTVSGVIDETVSDMDVKLKELEELKKEQSGSTISWRPPGDATQHMIPFQIICEMDKIKKLESKIEKEQESLNIYKARLLQKRTKARELHKDLLNSMKNIEEIVSKRSDDFL